MLKLSEIKLVNATTQDFARALNYSMRHSPVAAKTITGQLSLTGPMTGKNVLKMYPDTFSKSGKIKPETGNVFTKELAPMFPNKSPKNINMLDFAKAITKIFNSRG